MDVMELGVAIKAHGQREAEAALKQVENAGKASAKAITVTTEQARKAVAAAGGDMSKIKANLAAVAGLTQDSARKQVVAAKETQEAIQRRTMAMIREHEAALRMDAQRTAVAQRAAQEIVAAKQREAQATMAALHEQALAMDRQRTQSQQALATAKAQGDAMRMRMGMGAIQVAGALEIMARQGKVTGEALRQIVVQGSLMAALYGPTGAIVGAVGVAGVALFSFFTRAKREAEELRKKTEQVALSIRAMGVEQASALAVASKGDADRLRREIAALEAENEQVVGVKGGNVRAVYGIHDDAIAERRKALAEATDTHTMALKRANEEATRVAQINVAATRITAELAAEEKARTEGLRRMTEEQRKAAEELRRLQSFAPITAPIDIGGVSRTPGLPAGQAEAPSPFILPEKFDPMAAQRFAESAADALNSAFAGVGQSVGQTFSMALVAGFSGGFDNLGNVLLQGLGGIMMQLGAALVTYGVTMMKLLPSLANPFLSGPAALAAGGALIALGAAATAAFGGGSAGGGGGYSGIGGQRGGGVVQHSLSPQAMNAGRGVTARQPVIVNQTIIGERDPKAQRAIANMVRHAAARGIA